MSFHTAGFKGLNMNIYLINTRKCQRGNGKLGAGHQDIFSSMEED